MSQPVHNTNVGGDQNLPSVHETGTRDNTSTVVIAIDNVENSLHNLQVNSARHSAASTSGIDAVTISDEIPPPKLDFTAPPPYEAATKLPSYEEVQREKTLQGEPIPHAQPQIIFPSNIRVPQQPLTILAIDTDGVDGDNENRLLGTDFMFLAAFLVAFLFNWIGFLLLMCFCHTIASRYGALCGFGLSLTKWTLIVKQSTELGAHDNSWLWWLIMTFGLLICVRAFVQYLNIKRGWHLLSGNTQERLLFYY